MNRDASTAAPAGDHRYFRPLLMFFMIFVVLQLGTGFALYAWKIGLHPASTLEYYLGSERMLETYPDRPDRFLQARTFEGLLKIAVGHLAAYGLTVFLLTHLVRSLSGRPAAWLEYLCAAYYVTAGLEIFSGFVVWSIPYAGPLFRTLIFLLFEGLSFAFIALLLGYSLARKS